MKDFRIALSTSAFSPGTYTFDIREEFLPRRGRESFVHLDTRLGRAGRGCASAKAISVSLFIVRIVKSMSTSATLLALLEQEPAYGYTLKRRYDECFGHTHPVAFGQVYAALSSFDRQGYAEVTCVDSDKGPNRKRYRITAEGSTVVERWIGSPEPATSYASSALFAKVSIALMSGRSAHAVLTTQREAHLQRMRALTKRRRAADTAELLAITFELNHLDADLKWIEEAGRRLADLGREVGDD